MDIQNFISTIHQNCLWENGKSKRAVKGGKRFFDYDAIEGYRQYIIFFADFANQHNFFPTEIIELCQAAKIPIKVLINSGDDVMVIMEPIDYKKIKNKKRLNMN